MLKGYAPYRRHVREAITAAACHVPDPIFHYEWCRCSHASQGLRLPRSRNNVAITRGLTWGLATELRRQTQTWQGNNSGHSKVQVDHDVTRLKTPCETKLWLYVCRLIPVLSVRCGDAFSGLHFKEMNRPIYLLLWGPCLWRLSLGRARG